MRWKARALGALALATSLGGATLLGACDSLGSPAGDRAGTDADRAELPDSGSPPITDGSDAGARDPDGKGLTDPSACFDGIDNDLAAGADCSDARCAAAAICCVGVASAACCGAPTPVLDWSADECASGPIEACASSLALGAPFGLPRPVIEGGGIVANGGPAADSGMVLGRRVAPGNHIVTLTARLAAPLGCEGCVDGIGVGLIEERASEDPRITPVVAIHVSGSRGEVSLVAGNTTLWHAALPDAEPHAYTLSITPAGAISIRSDHAPALLGEGEVSLPTGELAVAIYGRRTNRSASDPPGARLLGLELEEASCDMPGALERNVAGLRTPIGAQFAGRAHAPSVGVRPDDGSRLAFAASGAIWMARPDGVGGWEVPAGSGPVLRHDGPSPLVFDHPSLIAIADHHWALFVSVRDPASGRSRIQVVEGGAGFEERFDPRALRDALIEMPRGIVEMDGPSAFLEGTELRLVARARTEAGDSQIVLLSAPLDTDGSISAAFAPEASVCGTGCANVAHGGDQPLHVPRHGEDAAFDRDEVAAPALIRTSDGVYRLYYAGRLGTRWSIGMLVSMDLRFFRDPLGRAVLRGSGSGKDALSVGDPEPVLDAERGIVLLHTGYDGAQSHVLAAAQAIE